MFSSLIGPSVIDAGLGDQIKHVAKTYQKIAGQRSEIVILPLRRRPALTRDFIKTCQMWANLE